MKKKYITFEEFCEYLGISHYTGYKAVRENRLKSYKRFGKLFFDLAEIEEYISESPNSKPVEVSVG